MVRGAGRALPAKWSREIERAEGGLVSRGRVDPDGGVLARERGGLMEREAWPVPCKSFRAWAGKGVSGASRPHRFPGPGKGETHPLSGSASLILNNEVDLFGIRLLGIALGKEKGPTLLASALGLPGCGGLNFGGKLSKQP